MCPYLKRVTLTCLHCKRGYVPAIQTMKKHKIKKHYESRCMDKYTKCHTYKKLEQAW